MIFSFLFTVCSLCFMWQFTCACACACTATYFPALYIAMPSFTWCTEQHPCNSAKRSITTDHKLCWTRFHTQKTEQLGVSCYSLWINLLDQDRKLWPELHPITSIYKRLSSHLVVCFIGVHKMQVGYMDFSDVLVWVHKGKPQIQRFPSIFNEAPCGPAAVVAHQSKSTSPGTGFAPCSTSWSSCAPAANHLFRRSTRAQRIAWLDISCVNYIIWLLHNLA